MKDAVKLQQTEEVVHITMKDERVNLRINDETYILKVSGQGPSGAPGASPVSCTKVRTQDLVDTYRLLMSDGSEYFFDITNGAKGEKGDPGANGGGSAAVIEEEELLVFTPEVEPYEGARTVTPTTEDQTLDTSMKFMTGDVTVKEIPYGETSNEAGGYTASIGG